MTDWLLDPDVAYLNHGSFGALPVEVGEAAAELRAMMERNPADLLARRLPDLLNGVRTQVAALLNADEAGCAFVANATSGTATVLAALAPTLGPGDEILTTDHRYGAVAAQLTALSERYGLVPVYAHVPLTLASTDDVVAAVLDRVTAKTRLLVIDSIASLSGFVFPVAELVAAAHARGVAVLVDAAHAPGQIAVDATAIGADFWVGNLHKWVCCPRALGVLSVAPQWRDTVRPLVPSHGFAEGYQAAFDWTGTFDPVGILSVPAAIAMWERLGWAETRERRAHLVDDGAATVAKALGTSVPIADEFRAAMRVIGLPVALDDSQSREVEARLSHEHRIEVSVMTLHDAAWLRVCAQVYNTPAHYERLADALPGVLDAVTSHA